MHGLYLLWWMQEKQIPPAVVAASLAAGDLVLLAVELPTGWFADRFGHRASLILGSFIQVAGMLWCWLGEGISGLVTASVLVALGDGFRSGAPQALLYRTCLALDREELFQRIEARTTAVETCALVGLVLAGGAIVNSWGFGAGWIAEILLCAGGLAIACAMTEPPRASANGDPHNSYATRHPVATRLAGAILPAALLGGIAGVGSFLAQTAEASNPTKVTLLVAAITLAEAAGSALAPKLPSHIRGQIVLAVCGGTFFAVAMALPASFVIIVPVLALLDGMARPLRATLIQRLAADDVRARLASLASACDMAVSTIALPVAGFWRQR
jgi:MFS family permease